jgi:hypothetical protein
LNCGRRVNRQGAKNTKQLTKEYFSFVCFADDFVFLFSFVASLPFEPETASEDLRRGKGVAAEVVKNAREFSCSRNCCV